MGLRYSKKIGYENTEEMDNRINKWIILVEGAGNSERKSHSIGWEIEQLDCRIAVCGVRD